MAILRTEGESINLPENGEDVLFRSGTSVRVSKRGTFSMNCVDPRNIQSGYIKPGETLSFTFYGSVDNTRVSVVRSSNGAQVFSTRDGQSKG